MNLPPVIIINVIIIAFLPTHMQNGSTVNKKRLDTVFKIIIMKFFRNLATPK